MKIDVLPGLAALDEGRWNALLDRSRLPSLFLTWQWQTEWSRAFAVDRPQQILPATDADGSLAGVLPLYEDEPGRQRILLGIVGNAQRSLKFDLRLCLCVNLGEPEDKGVAFQCDHYLSPSLLPPH